MFNNFSSGAPESTSKKILLAPLCILSFFYGLLVRARVRFYRLGIFRSAALPCKVVSVGNITLGGTGKTPFVVLLARWLRERGVSVAVLSRGYKGTHGGRWGTVGDGQKALMGVREAGDESYLLVQKLPGVPVLVGRERLLSGREAAARFQSRVLILDDGYQHLPLKRDVNLLLIDALRPFGNGWLFPRGTLREPPSQIQRADAVILTKADLSDNIRHLKNQLRRWAPDCPVFPVRYLPEGLWDRGEDIHLPLESLKERKVLAFSGIGSPDSFRGTLESLGARVLLFRAFRDHHWYRPEDLRRLFRDAAETGAEVLVTTEKDSVRLENFSGNKIPLWVLSVRHVFSADQKSAFESFLWGKLGFGKDP